MGNVSRVYSYTNICGKETVTDQSIQTIESIERVFTESEEAYRAIGDQVGGWNIEIFKEDKSTSSKIICIIFYIVLM